MAKDIHKILRRLADEMICEPTEEHSNAVLNELVRLVARDDEIIIEGNPLSAEGQVEPAALTAGDGLSYINIYTDYARFSECCGDHSYVTNLRLLLMIAFESESVGGITINYKPGKPVVMISKMQIYETMQKYMESLEEERHV